MKYKRISVIDNYQEELWRKAEQIENSEDLPNFMLENCSLSDGNVIDELPIYDEVIYENDKYAVTYNEGMCETLSLYEII